MSAVYVNNLSINAGTDFEQVFTLASSSGNSDVDLSGYTGEAKLAKHAGAAEANKVSFAVSFVYPSEGVISISLTEEQTSVLSEGRYVYDVVINDGSRKTRVVEGMAFVSKGVV
jgi:hypothetical protein